MTGFERGWNSCCKLRCPLDKVQVSERHRPGTLIGERVMDKLAPLLLREFSGQLSMVLWLQGRRCDVNVRIFKTENKRHTDGACRLPWETAEKSLWLHPRRIISEEGGSGNTEKYANARAVGAARSHFRHSAPAFSERGSHSSGKAVLQSRSPTFENPRG